MYVMEFWEYWLRSRQGCTPRIPPPFKRSWNPNINLTKITDDKSDIVTAGSVLVLQKDKVLMVAATSTANPCMNTYKDGKISPTKACGVGEKLRRLPGFGHVPGGGSAPATRNFVSGEKFWLTKIDVKADKVVLDFFTDATPAGDQGIRYKAALTIPFGALTPTPDEALKAVAEVITVAPSDDAKDAKGQAATKGDQQEPRRQASPRLPQRSAPAAPRPARGGPTAAASNPRRPRPPTRLKFPRDKPSEQVVAAMGQPVKKAKIGTKEIYYYKDLKVTFVNGKVKDVQ